MDTPARNEGEERIAALEKRVRDMEALVRGLTAELLDLKAAAPKTPRRDTDRSRQQLKTGTIVRGTVMPGPEATRESPAGETPAEEKVVIRPKGPARQEEIAVPQEPAMVRIMQPDGTFKLEPRRGNRKMF